MMANQANFKKKEKSSQNINYYILFIQNKCVELNFEIFWELISGLIEA